VHDVVVYLSSLPRIADRNRKTEVLRAMAQGAKSLGLKTLLQSTHQVVPARLAVILGWVGTTIRGAHIQLRQDVIDHQRHSGHKVLAIDGSCFKFADPDNVFLRYSLDGVYYGRSNYANANSTDHKWQIIATRLGLRLQPWRDAGKHILVCLQRDGGWSMKGLDINQWVRDTVRQIRQHSHRPILIRPHPKAPLDLTDLISQPDIYVSSPDSTLAQDLDGAWASVFFNSSSCVASVLAGVPVFASDDDCVAWAVANHDLAQIEQPNLCDREQWLWDLSAAHWCDDESRSGHVVERFRPWL